MKKGGTINIGTREKIYSYILKHPGIHLRDLSRKLNISVYNLSYHINILEKNEAIKIVKVNNFSRYYVTHTVSNGDKVVLGFLRQKTTRNILLIILYNIAASQQQICDLLQKSPSTIHFQINRLLEKEIITIAPAGKGIVHRMINPRVLKKDTYGREIMFRLTDPKTIFDLFNKYKDTLLDDDTKIILEGIWISMESGIQEEESAHIGTEGIDATINVFYEMFPIPFCC